MENDSQTPFDLSKRCFRSALIRLGSQDFLWYLNLHHIIADVWSVSVLYRRLSDLYELELSGTPDEFVAYPQFAAYRPLEQKARESLSGLPEVESESPPVVSIRILRSVSRSG